MTRASPRGVRVWKSQSKKWLGRLLGCVTLRGTACGRGCSSDLDLPDAKLHPPKYDVSQNKQRNSRNSHGKLTATSADNSAQGKVVLLEARGVDEDKGTSPFCEPTEPSDTDPTFPGLFGELEMALFSEGLLEYRDPHASVPVLTIANGFSDEELRALSKARPAFSKDTFQWKDQWPCTLGYDKLLPARGCHEPLIDGLPASVWLECVEPTLSILISLNTLRHRRSNLSLKKGLPETLDSNRSRHGDFEFGPIAIFHHPRRMEQLMLLRVDFLNAAAAATANGHQLTDINQSAEHSGRRGYNRNRRFRHPHSVTEIFTDDVSSPDEDAIINVSSSNNNSEHDNNNNYYHQHCVDTVSGATQNIPDLKDISDDTVMDILNFQVDAPNGCDLLQNQEEMRFRAEPWKRSAIQNSCWLDSHPTQPLGAGSWVESSRRTDVRRSQLRGSSPSAQTEMSSPKNVWARGETACREEMELMCYCSGFGIVSEQGWRALSWEHQQDRNNNARNTEQQLFGSYLGALVTASSAVMLAAAVPNAVDPPPQEPPPLVTAAAGGTSDLIPGETVPLVSHRGDGINFRHVEAPETVPRRTMECAARDSPTGCVDPATPPPALAVPEEQAAEPEAPFLDDASLQLGDDVMDEEDVHDVGGDNELKLLVPSLKSTAFITEVEPLHSASTSSAATATITQWFPSTTTANNTSSASTSTTVTRVAQSSRSAQAVRRLARSAHDLWTRWRSKFRDNHRSKGHFGRLRER